MLPKAAPGPRIAAMPLCGGGKAKKNQGQAAPAPVKQGTAKQAIAEIEKEKEEKGGNQQEQLPPVKKGDILTLYDKGGVKAKVRQLTTTDVQLEIQGSKEVIWLPIEDAVYLPSEVFLNDEVKVGVKLCTTKGEEGTVLKRTTTEVLLQTASQQLWVPAEDITVLKVGITGAVGLRNADLIGRGNYSDPYCICMVEGKPETKVKTKVVDDMLNPQWNFEARMVNWVKGESLVFQVWDKDLSVKGDDHLGNAILEAKHFYTPNGFWGQLPLVNKDGEEVEGLGYLVVHVLLEQGGPPEEGKKEQGEEEGVDQEAAPSGCTFC